jgi:hypothetical protein
VQSHGDHTPRAAYYALGLMARNFSGPAKVYHVDGPAYLRVAAIEHADGSWRLALVNRRPESVPIEICYTGSGWPRGEIRKYVYTAGGLEQRGLGSGGRVLTETNKDETRFSPVPSPQSPAPSVSADLPNHEDQVIPNSVKRGGIPTVLAPLSLSVFRYCGDQEPPEIVRQVTVADEAGGGKRLTWEPVADKDLCYYRVYRLDNPNFHFARKTQLGSTVATSFLDRKPPEGKWFYHVIPVDRSGNAARR